MLKINGTTIELTRADTLQVQVHILDKDGEEYTPKDGDVVRFALKKNYYDGAPLVLKTIPNDTLVLVLDPQDTAPLKFGNYVYDIEITMADGTVDTFINKGKFVVSEEVH